MTVALDSSTLRSILHRFIDGLLDELEGGQVQPTDQVAQVPMTGAPRRGEVLIGVQMYSGIYPFLVITIPEELTSRLRFKPPCSCGLRLKADTLTIGPGKGARVVIPHGTKRALIRAGSRTLGWKPEAHASEPCTWSVTADALLVIQMPAWLTRTQAPKPSGSKRVAPKVKDAPAEKPAPATGKDSALHCSECHAARKASELYECPICTTVSCKPEVAPCWQAHVRKRHHSTATRRAPSPRRDLALRSGGGA